ncbi:MAG: GAF domain-containing sensor histidine kinase [Gammaproteobacteria bacterium]|nr:GAF domain-containing sensor histidine kinase [Gammaproteobacteria bacterium]MBV9622269.1 GAF domain-containing sensor histidine kinase [Gammaproteobacteria bacterium]
MSANLAPLPLEDDSKPPCAESLSRANESLQARERLLTATARASRLLLQAPDVRAAIPGVLGLIGEAAHVDRVSLLETRIGPHGEPLLVVVSEWTADGVPPHLHDVTQCSCDERQFTEVCAELRAGRSVCFSRREGTAQLGAIEGVGTRTKAIVPIFVAGEFTGIVGFDNTRQHRAIDAAELAALETAAGVIGAALHRERLVDDVRREREHAAEERAADLAQANAVIRGNLERLAGETDLHSFMGHMLLEATRQFDAMSGVVIVLKETVQEWRIVAHVRDGQLAQPSYATSVPVAGSVFTQRFADLREATYLVVGNDETDIWPGVLAFHHRQGAVSSVIHPLMFGGRNVGFLALTFSRAAVDVQRSGLLVALAQQATLAVQLTRLAYSAKETAVLMERTRIGQEIHDGLAQAFTGILLQLGAVEEFPSCRKRGSELALTLSRIRELARDGLAEARRSVMALRLDQTRRAGLEIALRQLADRSTVPGGVTCTFAGAGIVTGLRPEHEHELLRIAQEALSNAVRHAKPRTVQITMSDEGAYWTLAVSDDGVGMQQAPELSAREGFGLSSMRQRAGAIGGEWQIESRPGKGTRVSVRMLKKAA